MAHLPGPQLSSEETFSSFPGAQLQVSPAALPEPQQGALCYHFRSRTPRPVPGTQRLFGSSEQPQQESNEKLIRAPTPGGLRGGRRKQPPRPAACVLAGVRPLAQQRAASQVNARSPPALALPAEGGAAPGLPGWGGRCRHRRGVLRARGSAVHHPADRCAGSRSQAARHGWRGRGQRSGRDARLPRPERGRLAARQEPARAAPSPAGPPPECASTCGPGSQPAGAWSRGGGRRCCSPRPRVD